MSYMFEGALFNEPLNSWDVGSVTNMNNMFSMASLFNQDISSWDVSKVTSCTDFNTDSSLLPEYIPDFTCQIE